MGKKNKTLTPEEILAAKRLQELKSIEDMIPHLNEPTYKFEIGEKVKYGNLKDCIVKEILYDGKVYGLECISEKETYGKIYREKVYRVTIWTNIRPLTNGTSNFAKNQDIKINFVNSTIESLIFKYYAFGINMNPDYQREYVWELKDKILLIDSIFNNVDIGKFALNHLNYNEWIKTGNSYEILDGKQRLNTIIDFYENRFSYNGFYYNDLSYIDKYTFLNHNIVQGEISEADKKAILNYFLLLNRTGKSMNQYQLNKVEKMLEQM